MEMMKRGVCELEDRSKEILHAKEQREKNREGNKLNLRGRWVNSKVSDIHVVRVPGGKRLWC